MNGNDNVGGGSNGNGAFPSTFFMWRITRRITRSLTQTNPSPRQRQQQRQVNRKPSKNTTGHRHTARAAVQRAATNSRPRPHPRHTPTLIAASASGHSYKERAFRAALGSVRLVSPRVRAQRPPRCPLADLTTTSQKILGNFHFTSCHCHQRLIRIRPQNSDMRPRLDLPNSACEE